MIRLLVIIGYGSAKTDKTTTVYEQEMDIISQLITGHQTRLLPQRTGVQCLQSLSLY